jgi:hypothetical protein
MAYTTPTDIPLGSFWKNTRNGKTYVLNDVRNVEEEEDRPGYPRAYHLARNVSYGTTFYEPGILIRFQDLVDPKKWKETNFTKDLVRWF